MNRPGLERVAFGGLVLLVAGVFVWAGAAKLNMPFQFARVTGFLLPDALKGQRVAVGLALFIATAEITLGAAILLMPGRRSVLWLALVALAMFTCSLLVLRLSANAPSCGCLGLVSRSKGDKDTLLGLVRNTSLLWMLGWLLVHSNRSSGQLTARPLSRVGEAARGFTLVELLVVITVIGIVVALAVPALTGARAASRISARVQLIRQLDSGLEMYCQAHRETFPYFATPGQAVGPVAIRGFELPPIYFRSQRWFWASVVVPGYVDVPRQAIEPAGTAEHLVQELGWPDFIIASSYQVTSTVFASPRFWRDDPDDGWNQNAFLAPTRLSDVAFPSKKGLILADVTGPGGYGNADFVPVAMGDGSARAPKYSEFDLNRAVWRPYGSTGFPVEATRDGLAGWDF